MIQACEDPEVARLALEIKRYLDSHPQAADSVDGVVGWWLTRQRVEDSAINVQLALEWLVAQGYAAKQELAGKTIYTSRPAHGGER